MVVDRPDAVDPLTQGCRCLLNLARTHVAAYEIGRTRAAADDVLTGELHVPMADVAVA